MNPTSLIADHQSQEINRIAVHCLPRQSGDERHNRRATQTVTFLQESLR